MLGHPDRAVEEAPTPDRLEVGLGLGTGFRFRSAVRRAPETAPPAPTIIAPTAAAATKAAERRAPLVANRGVMEFTR
jgi:hypothetical protein